MIAWWWLLIEAFVIGGLAYQFRADKADELLDLKRKIWQFENKEKKTKKELTGTFKVTIEGCGGN